MQAVTVVKGVQVLGIRISEQKDDKGQVKGTRIWGKVAWIGEHLDIEIDPMLQVPEGKDLAEVTLSSEPQNCFKEFREKVENNKWLTKKEHKVAFFAQKLISFKEKDGVSAGRTEQAKMKL